MAKEEQPPNKKQKQQSDLDYCRGEEEARVLHPNQDSNSGISFTHFRWDTGPSVKSSYGEWARRSSKPFLDGLHYWEIKFDGFEDAHQYAYTSAGLVDDSNHRFLINGNSGEIQHFIPTILDPYTLGSNSTTNYYKSWKLSAGKTIGFLLDARPGLGRSLTVYPPGTELSSSGGASDVAPVTTFASRLLACWERSSKARFGGGPSLTGRLPPSGPLWAYVEVGQIYDEPFKTQMEQRASQNHVVVKHWNETELSQRISEEKMTGLTKQLLLTSSSATEGPFCKESSYDATLVEEADSKLSSSLDDAATNTDGS